MRTRLILSTLFLFVFQLNGWAQFNGEADSTFGTDGVMFIDVSANGDNQYIYDTEVGPDGKLYMAGYYDVGQTSDAFVCRLNFDGTLDSTFAGLGFARLDPQIGGSDVAKAISIGADGKIVLAGSTKTNSTDYLLARLNPDGSLDTTFNGNGYLIFGDIDASDVWNDVVQEPDGRILAAGYISEGLSSDMTMLRIEADGTPVSNFGTLGMVTFDYGTFDRFTQIVRAASNRFYMSATTVEGHEIIALSSTGTLVNGFGNAGRLTVNLDPAYDEEIREMKLADDGGLLIAGIAVDNNNKTDSYFAKFLSGGVPDTSFGRGGAFIDDMGDGYGDGFQDFEVLDDGNILMHGTMAVQGGDTDYWTMQINPSGYVNTSYGNGGIYFYYILGSPQNGFLVTDPSTGNKYLTGTMLANNQRDAVLIKLRTTFPVDTSGPVGIADLQSITDTRLYPNPTNSTVDVEFSITDMQEVQILLTDLSGKTVAVEQMGSLSAGRYVVRLNDSVARLSQGMYLVHITNGEQHSVLKFIKH